MLTSELIDAVLGEGGFDVQRSQALAWLDQRHKECCARSEWQVQEQTLATIAAGQATYTLDPKIVRVKAMTIFGPAPGAIGGATYSPVGVKDLWAIKNGQRTLVGPGGAFTPWYDSAGNVGFEIWPVPTIAGATLTGLCVVQPADLADVPGNMPVIPLDFHRYLLAGAIADGLARIDERQDEAEKWVEQFEHMVDLLGKRQRSRVAGEGPVQVGVAGYHF